MGRLRSDAQLEEKELSGHSKIFLFSQTIYDLTWGVSSCLSSLISSLPR